jgi:hypothetical protein
MAELVTGLAVLVAAAVVLFVVNPGAPPRNAPDATSPTTFPSPTVPRLHGTPLTTLPPTTTAPAPPTTGGAGQPGGGGVLSLPQATAAFASAWPAFVTAMDTGNTAALATEASPGVQQAVKGACGCGLWPAAYTSVHFSVPPQTGWPVSFLAEVQQNDYQGQPEIEEAVLTQSDQGGPWIVTFVTAFENGVPLLGTSTNIPAPATGVTMPAVGSQIAAWLNQVAQTDQVPNDEWANNSGMTEQANIVTSSLTGLQNLGLKETITFSAGPTSIAFPLSTSEVMGCGQISSHSVTVPTQGSTMTVTDGEFTGVAACTYSSIVRDTTRDTCWLATRAPLAEPTVFHGGLWSVTATPAG